MSPLFLLSAPLDLGAQTPEQLRQQAERALGRPITDEEILRRIRASGLTPEQIRGELAARGLPRDAADPYLAVIEGSARRVPAGTDALPLVEVLARLEAGERPLGRVPAERPPRSAVDGPMTPERAQGVESEAGLPIFGRELFRRATSQFQPVTTGPVPADYRLGPGDEVILVLTGGVEQAYQLTVSREGWIVIPDAGRVFVNGLTLGALEDALFNRLSQVYSGIRPGPEATTFLDITLGRLRANQVYVIGEVEEPSAYQVSSLATALSALYWAGGPGVNGSFRRILVNRGGRTVREIDLYDYLVRGDASRDVRLEQGDIVYVPPAERRVAVDGPVTRPGLYELREGETLREGIRFAGGLRPDADLRRVQIARILPPERRAPGQDRAILDVSLTDVEGAAAVDLRDGDRITLFAVLEEERNWVTLSGAVWHPGRYAVEPGMRLSDLIRRAGGLLPDAYEGRAQIQRLQQEDWTRRMLPVSLAPGPDGRPAEDPELRGMDQVFVYARRDLRDGRVVSVGGWVKEPGVYPFVDGMTLRDLVLQAGGLRTGAYLEHAEVSRVVISQARSDSLTRRFRVPLDQTYLFEAGEEGHEGPGGSGASDHGGSGASDGAAPAPEFTLRNLDAVFIRKAPGFEPQQTVQVTGEVLLPGPYALETRQERITDLVERAGGLTPEAYPEGVQLWRAEPDFRVDTLSAVEIAGRSAGADLSEAEAERLREAGELPERMRVVQEFRRTRVGVDFLQALRRPDGTHNILVEPNDSIFVPGHIPTVQVRGAVGVETKVLHRRGAGLGYYIDQAGGYLHNADRGRTRVRYANGEVRTRGGKFLFFGGTVPKPDPGSVITVPGKALREGGGVRLTELIGILTSVATAAATIIIATR